MLVGMGGCEDEIMEIAEAVVVKCVELVGCDVCDGVWLVTGEEVEMGSEGVMAVTVECVVMVVVSMVAASVAAEGDPPLAMRGCELVRCVDVGGAWCCWGGVTGVKAERREG